MTVLILTFGTETSVVLFTLSPLDSRIYMKVEAVVTAVAESKGGVEPAFGDPSHVVFVQVVTLISLLAETSKPMLTYCSLVRVTQCGRALRQEIEVTRFDVPSGTRCTARTLQTF